VRAHRLGREYSEAAIFGNEKILEVLNTFRETLVKNRQGFYTNQIGSNRMAIAENSAEMAFMPNISKYVIEYTLFLGEFIVSAAQFLTNDSAHAIGTLSIFLAAGSRIAPALLRIQQEALSIRNSAGTADPALHLIDEIGDFESLQRQVPLLDLMHQGFVSKVEIRDVSFKYEDSNTYNVANLTTSFNEGEYIAIVGPSGAGKTTLVDLILGVLRPGSGTVEISGVTPMEAIRQWPGSIGWCSYARP
jgi:ABC-type multidrug transport system fused ATPase/permease subunit